MHNQTTRPHRLRSTRAISLALVPLLALASCSSGTGPSSFQEEDDFALLSTNVEPGAVWELNRPIELRFNAEVDLNTVTSNTVSLVTAIGSTSSGQFSYGLGADNSEDRTVILYQPACPTLADLSDSGLQEGGVAYTLKVQGGIGNQTTVRDINGRSLENGGAVPFTTASGTFLGDLFVDTNPGPPGVRVRGGFGVGLDELSATYLEIGGDPDQREYFQLNQDLVGELSAGVQAPLNLYSLEETRVAVMLFLDQPVAPGDANVNNTRLGLEWRVTQDEEDWAPLVSNVRLDANCTETGAIIRIEPLGVLPEGAELRIIVRTGLSDLTGELTVNPTDRGGRFETQSAAIAGQQSDEILELFTVGAPSPDSQEDDNSINGLPRASWGEGLLEASFDFEGSGGIGGNFDLVLTPGQELFVSTTFAQVVGGPDGTPSFTQDVIDGVLDVNDLRIGLGASLTFLGPNPATILASGEVEVAGEISVRGSNNNGVGALNTPNMPEVGSAGNAGGGTGGTGSQFITQSTPRGGTGFGMGNQPSQGGQGGETGYGLSDEAARRGAGGGGGRLGRDVFYDHDNNPATPDVHCQALIGMDAEMGCGGTPTGLGAISQSDRPMGGAMSPFPFLDDSDDNDFLGSMVMADGQFVLGEAGDILGGAGGGGGGDAVRSLTFPLTPFSTTGDEKGSGGGGAAGGLRILAIGPIIVRETGSIVADGGYGGGGENTFDSARTAGGGGGGSGGHIVLSSAAFVDVQAEAVDAGDGYRDNETALTHFPRPLSALGGQGGEGRRAQFSGAGGASGQGNTQWRRDGVIPVTRLQVPAGLGGDVPPLGTSYINFMPDYEDPLGPVLACAGDGSPGIIQIHLEDPALDLRFTHPNVGGVYGVPGGADVTRSSAPPPFGWKGANANADNLLPFFGRFSASQSEWIHLGLPALNAAGDQLPVDFLFDGVDPNTGVVNSANNLVDDLPPVLGPATVGSGAGEARILDGGISIEFDSAALPAIYTGSPHLLIGFDLQLNIPLAGDSVNYPVEAATLDAGAQVLTVFVAETTTTPEEYVAGAGSAVEASIVPRFLRIETDGQLGALPPGASIQILFDATVSNSLNEPDETMSYSSTQGGDFTGDVNDLSNDPWAWVRFRVVFDLSGGGDLPLDLPRPGLRFLRLPFQFQ